MADETKTGWQGLESALTTLRAELQATAPDEATAAEGDAYLLRVMTAGLNDVLLGHLNTENGLSRAQPVRGAPNPDYRIYHAGIEPSRRYRLQGCLNGSERIGVGLCAFGGKGESLLTGYAVFGPDTVDSRGHFTLEIGPDVSGPNTLPVTPDTRVLIVRILHRSTEEQSGSVRLSGATAPRDLTLATGGSDGALSQAGQMALRSVRQFLRWSQLCAAAPNRFQTPPPEIAAEAQGDPDTTYCLGYYELEEGQWLEVLMPEGLAGYWSLHAYNHWCESLPGAGVHDLNAVPGDDGRIRVRIGPALPSGLANGVDTLGRRRGVLVFRSIGSTAAPTPEALVRS